MAADQSLHQLRQATARLLREIEGLPDSAARGPSLLPGWTRGHVLSHLARNAEGGTRLLGWARTGVPSYEYEGVDARSAAIEEGAGRPASILVQDVRRTAEAFNQAAADMPSQAWHRKVRYTAGQEPRAEVIVPSRLAEVLIHHVDLDIGYSARDWPAEFVNDMLPRIADSINERAEAPPPVRLDGTDTGQTFKIGQVQDGTTTVSGPDYELLAWLLERSTGGTLNVQPVQRLPAMPSVY